MIKIVCNICGSLEKLIGFHFHQISMYHGKQYYSVLMKPIDETKYHICSTCLERLYITKNIGDGVFLNRAMEKVDVEKLIGFDVKLSDIETYDQYYGK